jgi:hypothetical protein
MKDIRQYKADTLLQTLEKYLDSKDEGYLSMFHQLYTAYEDVDKKDFFLSIQENYYPEVAEEEEAPPEEAEIDLPDIHLDKTDGDDEESPPEMYVTGKVTKSKPNKTLWEPLRAGRVNAFISAMDAYVFSSESRNFGKSSYSQEIKAQRIEYLPKYVGKVIKYVSGRRPTNNGKIGICFDIMPYFISQKSGYALSLRIFDLETGRLTSWSLESAELRVISKDYREYVMRNYRK